MSVQLRAEADCHGELHDDGGAPVAGASVTWTDPDPSIGLRRGYRPCTFCMDLTDPDTVNSIVRPQDGSDR